MTVDLVFARIGCTAGAPGYTAENPHHVGGVVYIGIGTVVGILLILLLIMILV